jgi:hypothetical protein
MMAKLELEANVEPEVILKFDFTPGIEIGFLPQQPEWGTVSLMDMGFLPVQGTSFLPYAPADLAVTGASPVEVPPGESHQQEIPASPSSPGAPGARPGLAPGASPGLPPGPPGVVRPHRPSVAAVSRISPARYLKSGIELVLYLDAAGAADAHVQSRFGMVPASAREHVISKRVSRKLAPGHYKITLAANPAGKAALRRHRRLAAEAMVSIAYDDKTQAKLTHGFEIAPAPLSAGQLKARGHFTARQQR